MKNYNLMRAFHQLGGSYKYYIDGKIAEAKAMNAPQNTLCLRSLDINHENWEPVLLEDCPNMRITTWVRLEKKLAFIEDREPRELDTLIKYLVSIGNNEALKRKAAQWK